MTPKIDGEAISAERKASLNWAAVKATIQDNHTNWRTFFDERQLKEIGFDRMYADEYSHGTSGHNERLVIARLSDLLDAIAMNISFEDGK